MDVLLNAQTQTWPEETLTVEVNDLSERALQSAVLADLQRRGITTERDDLWIGEPQVMLRHLADLLRKRLNAHEDTGVEWVSVIGEDSMAPPMKTIPARTLEVAMWNVIVQQGWSEGTLLYVSAQADRYKPEEQQVLLRIKVLCGMKQVGPHVAAISDWFANEEWRNA